MNDAGHDKICFDILLRGSSNDLENAATNLDRLRPSAETIESCFRWLTQQSITCYRTDFGLACEAEVNLFKELFQVEVVQRTADSGQPFFDLQGEPQPPREISHLVLQVTVAPRPRTLSDDVRV